MNQLTTTANDANIGPPVGGTLRSVNVNPQGATAIIEIRQNGSSGALMLTLQAPGNGPSFQWRGNAAYHGQLHATVPQGIVTIEL